MPLSDSTIRALRPKTRPYKRVDQRGLYIDIRPAGSKVWRWRYRWVGRDKCITLGRYPEVSIDAARRLQEDARRLLKEGVDPMLERRRRKLLAAFAVENTFGKIAREYIEIRMVGRQPSEAPVARARELLGQLRPLWSFPIADIGPAELLGALHRINAKGDHETARRCNAFASRVFRYAATTARAERNPAREVRLALAPKVRPIPR